MDQQPLVCASHTKQYIGVLIVGLVVGAGVMFAYVEYRTPSKINTYQMGFDAAKKQVEQSSVAPIIRVPDDIRAYYGVVTKIDADRITLRAQGGMDIIGDSALNERTVIITSTTKVVKSASKDPKVFQSEMDAYTKTMQANQLQANKTTKPATPPMPFTVTPATSADIIEGSILSVIATENIKTKKEFSASEIQILPKPIVLPPPASAK